MENEELYRSLVLLLKMFKNRPYHLAKYLVENSALTEDFIKKLKNSDKLKELNGEEKSSELFASKVQSELHWNAVVPESGSSYSL